jgi:hypothetical protein
VSARLTVGEQLAAMMLGLDVADGQPLCAECGCPMELVEPRDGKRDVTVGFGCPVCPYAVLLAWSEGYFGEHGRA